MNRAGVLNWVHRVLAHPGTKTLDLDDPRTSAFRRSIIEKKPMLRRVYEDWYRGIANSIPPGSGSVLELGSGPGFLRDFVPEAIASDVFLLEGLTLALDARHLPFGKDALRAIVMTSVFHHIPNVGAFLREAGRCVRSGGSIIMIEPWMTPWSRFVFERFHHEPIDPLATTWSFPGTGPLSDANIALPWIVFDRDRQILEERFPEWKIESVEIGMPLQYVLTGGVGYRTFVPSGLHSLVRLGEKMMERAFGSQGMVAQIRLSRTEAPSKMANA